MTDHSSMRHLAWRRWLGAVVGFLVASGAALLLAQGIRVMSGSSTSLATVTTNNALEVVQGESDRASYEVSVANQAVTTTDSIVNLHAGATIGFRVTKICVQPGETTVFGNAGFRLWQLIRRTSAPTAGVTIGTETTTGNNGLAKMDPADANWSGTAMIGGTEGTAGAILDSGVAYVRLASNTATQASVPDVFQCHQFGTGGDKEPIVAAGTANGVSLMFAGVTGGTNVSGQIHFVAN